MSFRDYLRWDGTLAVITGVALVGLGLVRGDQGAGDAVFGGAMMLSGTGLFMLLRHKVALRAPSAWYTAPALAAAQERLPPCTRGPLLLRLLAAATAGMVGVVGLSYLTGFWLTYMDVGVWAVAVGAIKAGPGSAAVARQETRDRCTYRVAQRSLRGPVQLTTARGPAPSRHRARSVSRA